MIARNVKLRLDTTSLPVITAMLLGLLVSVAAGPVWAGYAEEQEQMVAKAALTLDSFASDPSMSAAIHELKSDAKALFIVPQFTRGAFIFGGAGGSGVLIVRDEQTKQWSEPAFYNIGSGSFGLQIGVDVSEMVLVARTQKGLESFYHSNFKLGADVSMAVGVVGEGASLKGITADIVAYARKKGAFAGIAADGSVIAVSDDANAIYYGKPVRPTDILVKQNVSNPSSADLRKKAEKLFQ